MTYASASRFVKPRHLGAGTFALLVLFFMFVTWYGSLVPFHYTPLPWDVTMARWRVTTWLPLDINSRSDWVANILLFIPLGYLIVGFVAVDRGRPLSIFTGVLVFVFLAGLSVMIEFTQIWFPPRTVSMNDIVAETIGGAIGIILWVSIGQRFTEYARSVWIAMGPENVAVKLMPAYLILLVLIHVMPLDLTISPVEVYHKWKMGRVILVPFTLDYGSWSKFLLKTFWNITYFAPLGLLLSRWPHRVFRNGWRVLATGFLAAATIEFMQLFVWTRYFDVTDIITGTTAVWLSWRSLEAWKAWQQTESFRKHRVHGVWLRPSLLLAWFVAMAVVNWYPFDVLTAREAAAAPRTPDQKEEREHSWVLSDDGRSIRPPNSSEQLAVQTLGPLVVLTDWQAIHKRWVETSPVPMEDLYYNTEYHAFDEFLRKTLHFLPLGALLVPWSAAKKRGGAWRALLIGLFFACLFELGQLFVPDRFCSSSDVLIETNGAFFGFILWSRFLVLLEGKPAVASAFADEVGEPRRIPVGLGVFVVEESVTK